MTNKEFLEALSAIGNDPEFERTVKTRQKKRARALKIGVACTAAVIAVIGAVVLISVISGRNKTLFSHRNNGNGQINYNSPEPGSSDAGATPAATDTLLSSRYELRQFDQAGYRIILADNLDVGNIDPSEQEEYELQFDSVEQLVDTIVNDKFEAWQLAVIRYSYRSDENGIIVFDLQNPKYAAMPEGFSIDAVYWRGENYSFSLQGARGESAYIHWLSDDGFQSNFNGSYSATFEGDNSVSHKLLSGNIDEYVFKTPVATLKKLRYQLDDNTYVDETYRLATSAPNAEISDSVPYEIAIYHQEPGGNYIVKLFHPLTRYDTDYLRQFGLQDSNTLT